jgi:hypothetical protein
MAVVRKKASEFHVRGRLIDMDNVQRYLKRKRICLEDEIELSVATPPEVRCCTPDAIGYLDRLRFRRSSRLHSRSSAIFGITYMVPQQ